MSVESLAVVLHHSQASGTDKLVLVGIANHDGDGGAWPSVSTLAKYANVSTRSVNNSLVKLRELGEVIVYLQAGGTRNTADHMRTNRYEVLVRCPEGCDRTTAHRVKPVEKPLPIPVTPVDNSLFDPLKPASPPEASFTPPPEASFTPPPEASFTRTIITNHPENSSFESHSPADHGTCRACGQTKDSHDRYCRQCQRDGLDTELINCVGCSTVTKRRYHGQAFFYCPEHTYMKGQS